MGSRIYRSGGYPCGIGTCTEVLATAGALGGHRAQHKRKGDTTTAPPPELVTEYRALVSGWKMEGGVRREFTSVHHHATARGVAIERARIGEAVAGWQPHITEVTVECRTVTPWTPTTALDGDRCSGCGGNFRLNGSGPEDRTETIEGGTLCRTCADADAEARGEVVPW